MNQVTYAETVDSHWKGLYKVGGMAALLSVLLIPIQIVIFIT
jgi:hypothetical protein